MKTIEISDGDIQLIAYLNDRQTLVQRLRNRISLYLGEWSFVPEEGVDWFYLREKAIPVTEIEKAVRRAILNDSEVTGIESIEVILINTEELAKQYNKPMRTAIINCRVNSVYGQVALNL